MLEEPTGRLAVAVGPSREAAGAAFGPFFDDLVVTTYDDLATEVDLPSVHTLAIAAGTGAPALLDKVLTSAAGPSQVLVEVDGDAEERGRLADALRGHPETGVVATRPTPGGGVVLVLGTAGPGVVSGAGVAVVLSAAAVASSAAEPAWPEPGPAPVVEPGEPAAVPRRIRQRPAAAATSEPLVRRVLARMGRREWAALAAVALLVVLVGLLLVAIGRSDLGADGVLVSLLLIIGGVQAVTILAVAYLVRASRMSRRETAGLRDVLVPRTERLVNQGISNRKRAVGVRKRLDALQRAAKVERKHHEYVVELGRKLSRQIETTTTTSQRLHLVTQRQTQALLNLGELVQLEAAVPPAGGWAASPDLILHCVDVLLAEQPSLVVECGSGLSTLFLSLAAKQHGLETRIVALEHDEQFARSTRELLERHGVADRAEVRLAPLAPTSLDGHETPWYAESALVGLDNLGLLLVDGPPTATGPQVRFPAVPLLKDGFAARCTIVMDDLIRDADHQTADSWSAMLPDFDYSVIREFEKHVGILRRR